MSKEVDYKSKIDGYVLITCDTCGNRENVYFNGGVDFQGMHDLLMEDGWCFSKTSGKWFDFCSAECESLQVNPHLELTVREKYLLAGSIHTELGEYMSLFVAEINEEYIYKTHELLEILDRLNPVDGAELKQLEQAKPTRLDLKEPEISLLVNVLRRQCWKNNILYAEVEGCSDFTLEENSEMKEIIRRLKSLEEFFTHDN